MTIPPSLTSMPTAAVSTTPIFGLVGAKLEVLVTAEQTGGQFAMFRLTVAPGDPGPPLHTHTREDETFYLLDGSLTFTLDDAERVAQAGQCVFAPRDRRHKFRNPSDRPATALVCVNPAADDGFYGYVFAVGEPGEPNGPPSEMHVQKVIEFAPRHGMTFH